MKSKPCWVQPPCCCKLVFLASHRNVIGLYNHCCSLLLSSLLNSQDKDFSLLKARLCQQEWTHTFEPTLILLKVHKPSSLLLSFTKKHQSRIKHSSLATGMLFRGILCSRPQATQQLPALSKNWKHFVPLISPGLCEKQLPLLLPLQTPALISNQGGIQAPVTKQKHPKIRDFAASTKISDLWEWI